MKTKFVAHRGYSGKEKENTLPAFILAGECPDFDAIETDIHVTTDGKYIILHDETTNRVTNDKYKINVEEVTYEETQKVIIADMDGKFNRKDLRIPLASEYFETCKKYNKTAVCELKQGFNENQVKEIIEMVSNLNMIDNTIFISFNFSNIVHVRKFLKDIPLQFLISEWKEEYYDLLPKYNFGVDAYYKALNKEIIEKCHEKGIVVNAWTVNNQEDAKILVEWGIDFITSNIISRKGVA